MMALIPKLIFAADAMLVAATAWLAVCAAGLPRRGLVEASLGWLLLGLAWIAGSGILLGLGGGLGRTGFFIAHAAVLAALFAWRRSWRQDGAQWLDWLSAWVRLARSRTWEGGLAAGLILLMLFLAVLAAQVEPIVYDALTYRLSRIGAWLQDGWIRNYATDDPRLNYMPAAPDVVIAWLLGATSEGFFLAPLAQTAGGVLLLGSTYGLARTAGLARLNALGAVALVMGMGNVAVQFTTVQSDLFTAGVFSASYLLWHRALQRGEGSWVAGMGVALALGSKGTMFYLAPGAALWVVCHIWQHGEKWRMLRSTATGFLVAGLIAVMPGYWRNQITYGSWFGPREAVVLHHGEHRSPAAWAEKTLLNLGTSAVQALEPNAQPFWLQNTTKAAGERLIGRFSADADPYVFMGLPRPAQLEGVMRLEEPDADVITCGVLGAGIFFGGILLAIWKLKREAAARQIVVWGGGVVIYLLVQHAMVQWHCWAFRFMVLAAPWVAVVGAWGLGELPRKFRVVAWTVLLVSAADVFALVQWRTSQAAWQALMRPERSASYHTYNNWRTWTRELDHPGEPLRLALPINSALAAFYRLDPPRQVKLEHRAGIDAATAEEAVGSTPGWLLVPLDHFMGREGRVMGRVGFFSFAAYRALQPGERPEPMLYGSRLILLRDFFRHELVVRTWSDAPVRVELHNPGLAAWRFKLRTPTFEAAEVVAPGARLVLEVPVPADILTLVTVDFLQPTLDAVKQGVPAVRLVP